MKVHELITILQALPADSDVLIYDEAEDILPILSVKVELSIEENYRDRVPEGTTEKFVIIV